MEFFVVASWIHEEFGPWTAVFRYNLKTCLILALRDQFIQFNVNRRFIPSLISSFYKDEYALNFNLRNCTNFAELWSRPEISG